MHMSVQIQFRIIDKFIKFSPDVTSVLLLLTKPLDILHGNVFRIWEGFPKGNGPNNSLCMCIFTPKPQQLRIMKSTGCTGLVLLCVWWTTVHPEFLMAFRVFKHVCCLAILC